MTATALKALRDAIKDRTWTEFSKCKDEDPDIFFGVPSHPVGDEAIAKAKAICNGLDGGPPCPVRDECRDYALEANETFGVWGGLDEGERRKIKRQKRHEERRQAELRRQAEDQRRRRVVRKDPGWRR